ncbi:TetR/AcrR family transcriptional regulator [Arsenicicoccus sp. oral taxon 190]|uniref:TetR/AcrR family transcriptional regulator n=1 Tax=Arsenicicoccus sp. oral taxon 190 TaxID=1658671 RepID=UPI00067A212F|nr:TetR/AcrR family transcriptional regulator [Arsenicicoccus sp. oral taxon 190]AKT51392.1 TetR family transcriptional regulator [Arsenicicoccus sp. oral taxon 190]
MTTSTEPAGDTTRHGRLPRSERRAQLLEAAQDVFVEAGYHAAAMDAIAERAGVSKPVLYQHFPSKKELYLALLDQHCQAIVDLVRTALASTDDNRERVAATIAAYYEFFDRDGAPFRLVFESDLTGEAAVRERLDRVETECAEAIADVISEDAALPREHALLLGMALAGAAQNSARHWVTSASRSGVTRPEATQLVQLLSWRGIGGFPKQSA